MDPCSSNPCCSGIYCSYRCSTYDNYSMEDAWGKGTYMITAFMYFKGCHKILTLNRL